jgi:hypothetical protein
MNMNIDQLSKLATELTYVSWIIELVIFKFQLIQLFLKLKIVIYLSLNTLVFVFY